MLVKEGIAIRPYQADDVPFVARLAHEAFSEYTTRSVSHTLDIAASFSTLVALRSGRRAGFISVDANRGGRASCTRSPSRGASRGGASGSG